MPGSCLLALLMPHKHHCATWPRGCCARGCSDDEWLSAALQTSRLSRTAAQGGSHSRDLAFINAHLNIIGRCIVVSVLAFTACLWLTPLLGGAAWAARGLLLTANLLFLAWDHGNDFHTHGVYNW